MEFSCEYCSKPLSVPDGSSGRRCKCPSCGESLIVPDDSAVEIIEEIEEIAEHDGRLSIPCPKCHHLLRCSPDLLNTKGMCRVCHHTFLITDDVDKRAQSVEAPKLMFSCPKCDQLFEGKEEMRGRRGKCHVCAEVFTIELKPAQLDVSAEVGGSADDKPASAKTKPAAPAARPAAETPKSTTAPKPAALPRLSPKAGTADKAKTAAGAGAAAAAGAAPTKKVVKVTGPIRLNCPKCRGTMEVPGSSMGMSTACPYCENVFEINQSVIARDPAPAPPTPAGPMGGFAPVPDPFGSYPQAAAGPDQWANLGAGVPAPTMSPYASTYQAPRRRPRSRSASGRSPAVYVVPSVFLLICGLLAFGLWGWNMVRVLFLEDHSHVSSMPEGAQTAYWVGFYGSVIFVLVLGFISSVLMIAGGIAGILRRGLGIARAGAIGALFPCQCCLLPLPIGIWAAVIFFSSEAARDFE